MIRSCLSLLALAAVAMADPRQPSAPPLNYLFSLNITSGQPIVIGSTPLGDRVFEPIVGGSFSGPKLSGKFQMRQRRAEGSQTAAVDGWINIDICRYRRFRRW